MTSAKKSSEFSKPFYRQLCLQKRLQGHFDEQSLCDRVQSFFQHHPFHTVALYWPIKAEPDLRASLLCLKKRGCVHSLALPCVEKLKMNFVTWDDTMPMTKDDVKIAVPLVRHKVIPDCILIPCLAVDRQGIRLGYGGGWYDRTLGEYPAALKLAVVYEGFFFDDLPKSPTDLVLDGWITESAIQILTSSRLGGEEVNKARAD